MNNSWWKDTSELDDDQSDIFDLPLEQSHLILGPPGSGKTNLLLLRASQMTLSDKPNILILVFTRTLKEFIVTGSSEYEFSSDKVQTLDKWRLDFLREQGIKPAEDSDYLERRKKQLKQISTAIKTRSLGKHYQAIFLDEAQDYLPGELDIFFHLSEVVFGAADSRQQIYPSVNDAREQLAGRFDPKNIHTLKFHYRNGHAICRVADQLADSWTGYDKLMPTSNYPEAKIPSSVIPHQCDDIPAQVAKAAQLLDTQLKAYPDQHLAVLCPAKSLSLVWSEFQKTSLASRAILQSSDDGYSAFEEGKPICVCSTHAAKGLEFRAVHVINTENIGKSQLRRNITYMTVTRAKTSLSLYHSAELPPYIQQALLANKPAAPVAKLDQLFNRQKK